MPGSFCDSNVLLYLASGDLAKAARAEAIAAQGGSVSVQVLNEVCNVARRKMMMSWRDTHVLLDALRSLFIVHPVTLDVHVRGLTLAERYGFSIYDSMIVAAALEADCETLWSEDMQNGMTLSEGLTIINPFTAAG